jgi:hypothetical protein
LGNGEATRAASMILSYYYISLKARVQCRRSERRFRVFFRQPDLYQLRRFRVFLLLPLSINRCREVHLNLNVSMN